ncbi:metallophosphoesterase family protein [Acidithrix ferrooxidans]|uniref:Putative metallophosphoesterase YhaO n=1 Tax=Acidithrix ferrooxidans TaxID=1280514 RepID=A0A0D8HKS8_9ACTN|nr:DNA repair exonuclease [Acidithrix ferrooxidans]KJF18533.1 putative metallophosphoesterase YhaO [Acidithrix ferrooxidans]
MAHGTSIWDGGPLKFLHASDLHIDSPLRGLSAYEGAPIQEIRGATRRAVENLVGAAVSNDVDLVVLAGDIFDGDWKDYSTGLFWIRQLVRLYDEGIPVVLVAGNHDAVSEVSKRLSYPPNVYQLSSAAPQIQLFDELDLAVVGQSYASRVVAGDLVANFPSADPGLFTIGLLHTSLDGRVGHASYAPTTVDMLRSRGYSYWALGHVHQREVVSTEPHIVFAGNLQGRHIRETGPKGASLVTTQEAEVVSIAPLELDVVRWTNCYVDVSQAQTFEEVISEISQVLDKSVIDASGRLVAARVNISGTSPIHRELWRRSEQLDSEVRGLGAVRGDLWIEKVVLGTRNFVRADGEVVEAIRQRAKQLQDDPEEFASLLSVFMDLRNKLPLELRVNGLNGEESVGPTSESHLRATLESAGDLISSLLSETDPS